MVGCDAMHPERIDTHGSQLALCRQTWIRIGGNVAKDVDRRCVNTKFLHIVLVVLPSQMNIKGWLWDEKDRARIMGSCRSML